MSTIHLHGLAVYQQQRCLLDPLDLDLPPGEALTVLGESGSGKSLLAHAIMGTLPASLRAEGELRTDGRHYPLHDAANRRHLWGELLAILPQEPVTALDPTMRVLPQVAEGWRGTGAGQDAARHSLTQLGLHDAQRHYPHQLSGGMAQRVAFAAATLGGARLLLADEPSKGLDSVACDTLRQLLQQHLANGQCLLTITHDIDLARALGGQVLVMQGGEVVEHGPASRILSRPAHPYTQALLAAEPQAWPAIAHPAAGDWLLQGRGLAKAYGSQQLFRDVDIDIAAGERVALLARSGAGKSTLGNMLLGLTRPDHGSVHRRDGLPRTAWQKLYQDPVQAFAPRVTLHTALHDVLKRCGQPWSALEALLARLRLDAALLQRLPSQVSGGELQRLALIRTLLLQPALLFADEPTSRLDPVTQRDTMHCLLDELGRIGCALLLVTHDAALAGKSSARQIRL
ncbi:ABC transporter ATP-binding protein [Vogesella indigofera]|uniref:ABC transporter ATP-binding protein n=1 Tax=Vogesella indigofera TaxID=45465 RepID=UPI00234EB58C|nr:ATP-binding cassette domain-containing protein [Vogesella indigofera]MDC7710769.1 ATP-binding cassette domain-containing protein [Vogesella indigofera]